MSITDVFNDATTQILRRKENFIKERLAFKGFSHIADDLNNAPQINLFIKDGWEFYFVKETFIVAIQQEFVTKHDSTDFRKNVVTFSFNYSLTLPVREIAK